MKNINLNFNIAINSLKKSNNIINYFISLIESLLCFNYTAINIILQKLNLLPETIIILFGPIIVTFLLFFIFLFDNFYLIYLWFSNFGWFFKENVNITANNNTNSKEKPKWQYVTLEEPINYAWSLFLLFVFFILFWFVLFLALPVLPFITLTICVTSCFLYKGMIDKKPVHSYDIIGDVFKYNKVPIMITISLFCIISAFANLNAVTGWFSIFFILLIYFELIPINLFGKIIPPNLTFPLASSENATKTSLVNAVPYLSVLSEENNATEKKALVGGKKNNFIKKINKIISQ